MRYRMVWLVTLVLLFLWAGVSVVEARYLPFGTPDEKCFLIIRAMQLVQN